MYDEDINYLKNTFDWEAEHLQKGQIIMYKGEEAEVISVNPLLVIKTKNGVVCGALNKRGVELGKGGKTFGLGKKVVERF